MFTTATKTIAKIAWRNVTRNWRHSLASSLAILAGFTAVALFDGFICDIIRVNEEGFSLRGMAGHVLIQRKDAQFKLVEDSFAYSMTKAALNQMTVLLAKSCGPVRVNAVAPGLVETPWTKDWQNQHDAVKAVTPLHRSATMEDCVQATLGLLRTKYATGQIFVVDGGLTLVI